MSRSSHTRHAETKHTRHEGIQRDETGFLRESWSSPCGAREARLYSTGAYAGEAILVLGGVEIGRGDLVVVRCTFSADGRRFAYVKRLGDGREELVEDGRIWWEGDASIEYVSFSPDSAHLAWRLERKAPPGGSTAYEHLGFIDGDEIERYPYQPWGLDHWSWLAPWDPLASPMPEDFRRAQSGR